MDEINQGQAACGKPKDFFEKNPVILKSIFLLIFAVFLITLEYLFKLSENQIFQKIIKEEKIIIDFFLNNTFSKNV